MTKKQDEKMETIEEIQAKITQGEKDTNLTSLLYITRKLGELEGVLSTQAFPDTRMTIAKDDLLRVSESLIEKVGLTKSMRLQEQDLAREAFGGDFY